MPVDEAVDAFYARESVDAETLSTFMDDIGARLDAEIDKYYLRKDLSAKSCRLICEMLVDAVILNSVCGLRKGVVYQRRYGGLQHGNGASNLEDAEALNREELCSSKAVGLLLKWTIRCSDKVVINKVANMFNEIDPSLLGPVIAKSLPLWKVGELAAIVTKRTQWLTDQIELLDKPFSWEMPDAKFPDNPKVQEFLRGPDTTMKVTKAVQKFKSFQDANKYAAKWTREGQVNASFKMEASSTNANAAYTKELNQLKEHCGGDTGGGDKKRPRLG
ncbi:hypothetical protein GQ600_26035 [Phytophthora cactorum]|nr:hypothetical protein GQ600_26035 [Phytophthora cactorum]